jgi:hypothetical protein
MKITGPERYALTFDAEKFTVSCPKGTAKFSKLATSRVPKIYVISVAGQLIYVGITRQSMRARFRMGFSAKGENGYHGYAWRSKFTKAALTVWFHENASFEHPERDVETVEAEVVFLARLAGQWPKGQTEIHFHRSNEEHRKIAEVIWRTVSACSLPPASEKG